jgi:plastocyanin
LARCALMAIVGRPEWPRTLCVLLAVQQLTAVACSRRNDEPQRPAAGGAVGTVEGRVLVDGPLPTLRKLPTNSSVERHCGSELVDPSLRGTSGGLAGAVVYIDFDGPVLATESGTPDAGTLLVDQKGCLFVPTVIAARAGTTLVMKNSDPLVHNVRAIRGEESLFNVAMPIENMTLTRKLPDAPTELRLHCDVHPWMNAYVKTFSHPYFAVTDTAGAFRIPGVPAGAHSLRLYHPRLAGNVVRARVDIRGEGATSAELRVDATKFATE